jgi:hypothetical protein
MDLDPLDDQKGVLGDARALIRRAAWGDVRHALRFCDGFEFVRCNHPDFLRGIGIVGCDGDDRLADEFQSHFPAGGQNDALEGIDRLLFLPHRGGVGGDDQREDIGRQWVVVLLLDDVFLHSRRQVLDDPVL